VVREDAVKAAKAAAQGPGSWPGVRMTLGKEVVDLTVVDVDKGVALLRLRDALGLPAGSGGVVYIGDDVTDEHAFAVLDDATGDVTVKVGAGQTGAQHRIDDPEAVADVLIRMLDLLGTRPGHPDG
jgi:trehalose-phosphatase